MNHALNSWIVALLVIVSGCGGSGSEEISVARGCEVAHESDGLFTPQSVTSLISLRLESASESTSHLNDTHVRPGVDTIVYRVEDGETLRFQNGLSEQVTLTLFNSQGDEVSFVNNGDELLAEDLPTGEYVLQVSNTGESTPLFFIPSRCNTGASPIFSRSSTSGVFISEVAPPLLPPPAASALSPSEKLVFLENVVRNSANMYIFQPNTSATWKAIAASISQGFSWAYATGMIAGSGGIDSFSVACGLGVTMTGQDILAGSLLVVAKVALEQPADFTVLAFRQYQSPQ
jgi:hypothetical protein